jgi:hypothetical protein
MFQGVSKVTDTPSSSRLPTRSSRSLVMPNAAHFVAISRAICGCATFGLFAE